MIPVAATKWIYMMEVTQRHHGYITYVPRKFLVENITSSANTMFIEFASDNYNYGSRGFEIHYSSVEGKTHIKLY